MISEQLPTETIASQTVVTQRYQEYKDSGFEWIGEIPAHWIVKKLRFEIAVLTDYTANGSFADLAKNVQYLSEGFSRLVRLTDLRENLENDGLYVSEKAHKYLAKSELYGGEVLLANVGAYAGLACVMPYTSHRATLGPNMFLLRFRPTLESTFAYYALIADYLALQLKNKAVSSAQPKLNKEDLRSTILILPPLAEQTRITEFLDQKTAQIDQAIAQKERLIELLNERRQVMIHTAITRGLDPNASMKDSGIDWIGEIPAHWEVKRAKYIFDEIDERSETGDEELLSVSHMTGVTPRSEKTVSMFQSEDYTGSKLCKKDDLVFNIMWAWMGALGVSNMTGIVSPSYGVYRQQQPNTFNSWYLEQLMRDTNYVAEYNRRSTGLHSSRLRLYADMFFDMKIGFPGKEEQDKIAEETIAKTEQTDKGIYFLENQIKKLQELKSTLINSTVTGKIKI